MNAANEENSVYHCVVITEDNENGPVENSGYDYKAFPPEPESQPMNVSTNVLLVYRLKEMRQLENLNFALSIICLAYCGVNVALIGVNYVNSHAPDDPPVSDVTYHLVEFWGTFVFAVVECISLTSTPKSLATVYENPATLKLILFFNVVATLLPAVLVSLNLEEFEILSHNVEYMNELTMSFVDLVLLWSLVQINPKTLATAAIAIVIALVQLGVYNGMGRTENGDMVGEVPGHYLEFAFEIISSLIAFWFCMENMFVAAKEIGLILYGRHKDCIICKTSSNAFSSTYYPRGGGSDKNVTSGRESTYGSLSLL
mmetsp:Transcript_40406/g.94940  ORF Transcript_40406/g.94940 Transcript_40406/m.94940 type:complete len:314 (-) Transcript_40406:682-1623(-)